MEQNDATGRYVKFKIKNSFHHAPVFYAESTSSTMDDARRFALQNVPHGTVVCTNFQTKGRGRFKNREWTSPPGESLLFTIILKKAGLLFPVMRLPVMTGLALGMLCEEHFRFSPFIKWPNDIMFHQGKLAGILCEADNEYVFCGIGMNCNQEVLPEYLVKKAVSLFMITGEKSEPLAVCEKVLSCLWNVFAGIDPQNYEWNKEVEKRLYRRGENVKVLNRGQADALTVGRLYGVDTDGALLVFVEGVDKPVRVISGEVVFVDG